MTEARAQRPAGAADPAAGPWWRGASVYQIYPRSFLDSDGDGIGDLAGITQRLDYVAALGVDAVWISPFYPSPMADFGYDVADYCDVDPRFGTLADFDALVTRAHALGLRVTIDLVFAHTSEAHAWFAESRALRDNRKADWYVWADPKPDGTPPNNWQSVFGGPAWTWDARRRQYYMHQFLKEQPQLNLHNPAVRAALLEVIRFWLRRGVDGFRLDALNHVMFDPDLRDNGIATGPAPRTRPFDYQDRRHSQNHPGIVGFIEQIRAACDEFGAVFTVAEIGGTDVVPLMKSYTAGSARLSSAYSFDFLYADRLTPASVAAILAQWRGDDAPEATADAAEGWPSWAFENHDAPRAVSRWCPPGSDRVTMEAYCRLQIALLAALRGNIFLFQGQELGLVQDEIPFALLKDPEAIANWPLTLSRDGARTPMPWSNAPEAPHGGFTTGTPWLPLSPANRARAVDLQERDPGSVLQWTRRVLGFRAASPALRHGAFADCRAEGAVLRFTRAAPGETIACCFNLGPEPMRVASPTGRLILATPGATALELPGFAAVYWAA